MEIVDAHHHVWRLTGVGYEWINVSSKLYRDFLVSDLAPTLLSLNVGKTVLVQSASDGSDLSEMLSIAAQDPHVAAVVGWIDSASGDVWGRVRELSAFPLLRGLRPTLKRADAKRGLDVEGSLFAAMTAFQVPLDVLVHSDQLAEVSKAASQWSDLPMVLNHAGNPSLGDDLRPWCADIKRLGKCANMHCKISGLVTRTSSHATDVEIGIVLDRLIENFGPSRLMWGSDWPVVLLAESYEAWHERSLSLLSMRLSQDEISQVMSGTASRFYRLGR